MGNPGTMSVIDKNLNEVMCLIFPFVVSRFSDIHYTSNYDLTLPLNGIICYGIEHFVVTVSIHHLEKVFNHVRIVTTKHSDRTCMCTPHTVAGLCVDYLSKVVLKTCWWLLFFDGDVIFINCSF